MGYASQAVLSRPKARGFSCEIAALGRSATDRNLPTCRNILRCASKATIDGRLRATPRAHAILPGVTVNNRARCQQKASETGAALRAHGGARIRSALGNTGLFGHFSPRV
jgi:sulfite reductase beta subunit-like hemoprotein